MMLGRLVCERRVGCPATASLLTRLARLSRGVVGADVAAQASKGQTAAAIAREGGDAAMARLIESLSWPRDGGGSGGGAACKLCARPLSGEMQVRMESPGVLGPRFCNVICGMVLTHDWRFRRRVESGSARVFGQ
eukprot:2580263-Pleurochrysis_carterae.AAC.1